MPPKQYPVQSDLSLLLPSFRIRVEELINALKARGLKPRVWETYRSPERAAMLGKTGQSRNGRASMHCLGAAVDIVEADKFWSDPAFFVALGAECKRLGLTWGGDWDHNPKTAQKMNDRPHVQAIPIGKQEALRALTSMLERDAFVDRHLSSVRRVA